MKKIITGALCLALLVVLLGCPGPEKIQETYTVTFDSQGGSAVEAVTVTSGDKAARPTDPSKDGYSFAGWYKEADCTNVWNFDSDTVTASITLYAKWSLNSYTVTFNVNGGSEVKPVTASHGAKLTAPVSPSKEGYGFKGWYKEETLTTAWDFDKDIVTSNITLYAQWSLHSYTVTFITNGGSETASISADHGVKIIAPTAPVKAGSGFAGWYKEAACTNIWNFDTDTVTADITLYAKWSLNSYTIVFNSDGGTEVSSIIAAYGTKLTEPPAPTKTGYGFDGWYKEEAPLTKWIFATDNVTSSMTLKAKWLAGSFTITYELDGGTNAEANPANYTIETSDITFAAPTKTGYTFGGWFENSNLSGTAITKIAHGSDGDKKVYAKWTAIAYNIVYELNSGTNAGSNPASYTIETDTFTLLNPARTGYTFAGWYTTSGFDSGSAVTIISKGSIGNKVLYAKWTNISYVITYVLNGGTNASENPAAYTVETETITLANPTRTGYTFAGWYTTSGFDNGSAVSGVAIASGSTGTKTFYAKWTPNQGIGATVPVSADKAPVITGETTVASGSDVSLSIDGTWSSVAWYKNGIEISTEESFTFPSHVFSIGKNNITVIVTDADGNTYSSSVTLTITQ